MGRFFLFRIFIVCTLLNTAEDGQGQNAVANTTTPTVVGLAEGVTVPGKPKIDVSPLQSILQAMPKAQWVLDLELRQKIWEKLLDDDTTTLLKLDQASAKELHEYSQTLQQKQPRAQLIKTSLAFAEANLFRAALLDVIQEVSEGVSVFPGREHEVSTLSPTKESSEALRLRATNIYRRLVGEYGRTPELEEATLELCRQLTRQRNDNAEFYFREYFRLYKDTKLSGKALLAYGDFLLQQGKTDQAFASYKVVINDKKSDLYPYALLRYAWSSMLLGMASTAKDRDMAWRRTELGLKVALKQLPPQDSKASPKKTNLMREGMRRETLRALALMYGERAQIAEAQKVFAEATATEWLSVAKERLADRYAPHPQNKPDALRLYSEIGQDVSYVRYPFAKLKALDLLAEKGDWTGVQTQAQDMQKFLKQSYAGWQVIARRSGENPQELERRFEEVLHRLVIAEIKRQQKSEKAGEHGILAALFDQQFPKSVYQDEIALQNAVVSLQRGEMKAGVEGLEKFIGLQTALTPLLKEASMRRILAYDHWLKQLPVPDLPAVGKALKPIPFPDHQKNFLVALDFFAEAYPDDPSSPLFRKIAAFGYLSYGHYDSALQRYEDLAYQYPDSPLAKESLETIFGVLIEREEWGTVISKADSYLRSKRMAGVGLRRKLRESVQYAREQVQLKGADSIEENAAGSAESAIQESAPNE